MYTKLKKNCYRMGTDTESPDPSKKNTFFINVAT
jgi:hypothetical protein